jgi:site-specific DNA recombinase
VLFEQREEITERIVASVPIRAKLGKPLGGSAQYGYQWKDKKLVIHPEEGPVRKLMYERFAELGRKKAVAAELNKAGYRTRGGGKFSASTIGRLIQDPTPKGLHRTNYMKRSDDGSWVWKPESEWIYAEVEPLVSEELRNRCNQLLANSVNHIARPTKRTVHLFAGLAFCTCGEKMYVPRNSPKYVCRKCRTKIPAEDLEGIFFEQLKNFLVSNEQVEAFLGRTRDGLAEKQSLLASRRKEADRVRQEVDRTYRLYLDNEISGEAFGRFFRPVEERQKQLDEELVKLQADVGRPKVDSFSRDQVMADAHYLQEAWPRL